MTTIKTNMHTKLSMLIELLNPDSITEDRKKVLQPLIAFIKQKTTQNQAIRINFICTHNSRRSHLAQIWAQTLAHFFNIKNVYCYSAGTEATALYPTVVEHLTDSGFKIEKNSEQKNPVYFIKYADNELPIIGFSKTLDNHFNPMSQFAAVMTCSQADGGCPFIAGAEQRIPITFEDPKAYDHTPQEREKYNERSLQIATEMYYVFSKINS